MTSSNCLTTDRVAESMQYFDCDFFINVQGDEPLFNPQDLDLLLNQLFNPSTIYNGYCSIDSTTSFHSVTTPKVVFDVKDDFYICRERLSLATKIPPLNLHLDKFVPILFLGPRFLGLPLRPRRHSKKLKILRFYAFSN